LFVISIQATLNSFGCGPGYHPDRYLHDARPQYRDRGTTL